ncbi:hypothetical protein ACQ3I4_14545 [Zafaria sp. Z1313]|uniref:hypothetical protein n=1 Tax=unclassified Zafaria TaxID=2828765 RepID=UPI002E7A975D|nr:hypothetical protein [Zafaria sp. J156]MEE1622933.1 hypothetical protein [Zafaria sp. J156]
MSEYNQNDDRQFETATVGIAGAAPTMPRRPATVTKRRKSKTEKELYVEAEERAASLRERLLARRSKNRDELVEDLYRRFRIGAIDGDLDEADRIAQLRAQLSASWVDGHSESN